jgi:hypothetical protein
LYSNLKRSSCDEKAFENSLEHGRMTSLSDTLTVGLVLVLLFGSIALYLYTRLQQAEQKISLLESILLDLKMSAEIKSYSELPASELQEDSRPRQGGYAAFNDDDGANSGANNGANEDASEEVESACPVKVLAVAISGLSESVTPDSKNTEYAPLDDTVVSEPESKDSKETITRMSANYESMTLKELQTLAKNRGISGAGTMKKGSIIEALKTSDRSSTVEPGSTLLGSSSSSFLETSGSFPTASESS